MTDPKDGSSFPPLVRVTRVEAGENFVVKLAFSDGSEREVDLDGVLWGPVFEPIRRDRALFRSVRVDEEAGTIVWPNGADLDPVVLHGSGIPAENGRPGPSTEPRT